MKKAKPILTHYKVEILKSVSAKFLLSHNIGQVIELESKLADEMIAAGYAKKVK